MPVVSLGVFFGVSLLAGVARPFMAAKLAGPLNTGYLLIGSTYLACWGVAILYYAAATYAIDPLAAAGRAAAGGRDGSRPVRLFTLLIFALTIGITLAITHGAARRTRTASTFYAADGGLGAAENGFALAGDWMSAVAFLGFSGLTGLYGFDGSLHAVGALMVPARAADDRHLDEVTYRAQIGAPTLGTPTLGASPS